MKKKILYIFVSFFCFLSYTQETFRDEFNSVSYSRNDGTLNWSGRWDETERTSDRVGPDVGFIQIKQSSLEFRWIWNESIERAANLSNATAAVLSFNWETISLETREELTISISSNGVDFTPLATFGGEQSDVFRQDISAYISANTTIRFSNTGDNWSHTSDRARIDNIQIIKTELNEPPSITVTGNQRFCPGGNTSRPIVQSVTITDPDDTTVHEVSIQISTGYTMGQDILTLTGSHPNIIDSWNTAEGRLMLTGPASITEFEAAIKEVVYIPNNSATAIKEFSIVIGDALFLPETGHFYEFIPDIGIRWDDARDQAEARTYYGRQGYLATLTSAVEAIFAGSQITGNGWIGASDAAIDGQWSWVTGPEAGTLFWTGDETGAVVPGEFQFWNTGEPNNCCGGESYAHITAPGLGVADSWNDLPIGGGPFSYASQGYIVEYGGMPGDTPIQISGVTRIIVSCNVITNRQRTYRVNQ